MPSESLSDALTAATALAALKDACHQLNLTPTNARLLRIGENAIYTLPADNLVARIARSEAVRERVEREVATARWLADLDFPAVRLAKDLPQVVSADGRLVTIWQLATETDAQKTTADLGRVLQRFHALPPPPFNLPKFDPFSVVPARLAQPPAEADPADIAFLSDRHNELVETYQALHFDTPFGLIHGDAHRSNLIATPSAILLSDFEVVAHGPREWDLTPTALAVDRFGLPREEYDQFVDAYGRDVTQWHGYRTMCAIRELTMTTWLMQNISEGPEKAEEFHARVTSMREGDHDRQWKIF